MVWLEIIKLKWNKIRKVGMVISSFAIVYFSVALILFFLISSVTVWAILDYLKPEAFSKIYPLVLKSVRNLLFFLSGSTIIYTWLKYMGEKKK